MGRVMAGGGELDDKLREAWLRHRDEIGARLDVLDRAASALAAGELDDEARDQARQTAHQLAGTVGTFGYARASELAREVESELATKGTDPAALARLVASLRAELTTA
jgi:HPt (histidine-containing phosphotransfer) domain-containing protein